MCYCSVNLSVWSHPVACSVFADYQGVHAVISAHAFFSVPGETPDFVQLSARYHQQQSPCLILEKCYT